MEIDAYQLCPCQSGKKIKFCCGKDVMHELNDILENIQSKQIRAALDRIDRTIERSGPKDCLLVLKTHLLVETDQEDAARETNAEFLKVAPGNTMALLHRAMIALQYESLEQGLHAVQDAIDSVKGAEIPIAIANAYRAAAIGILRDDKSQAAALAHLRFAISLRGEQDADETTTQIFQGLQMSAGPFEGQRLIVPDLQEEQTWSRLYDNVQRAMLRGQFRRALQLLLKIDHEHPGSPIVAEAMAIVKTILCQSDSGAAWQQVADCEQLPLPIRVNAQVWSQLLSEDDGREIDMVVVDCELADFSQATESLLSSNRFVSRQFDPQDYASPPPRHIFAILGGPPAEAGDDLSLDDLPTVIGEILVFGKQTDRNAQISFAGPATNLEMALELLNETLDETLQESNREVTGKMTAVDALLSRELEFPRGVTREQFTAISAEFHKKMVMEEWPKLKLGPNVDLTIEQAAKLPEQLVAVHAQLAVLACNGSGAFFRDGEYEALVTRLGCPPIGSVGELVEKDPRLMEMPVALLGTDPQDLTTAHLSAVSAITSSLPHGMLFRRFTKALLQREDREKEVDCLLKTSFARTSEDLAEALVYFDEAVASALETGNRNMAGMILIEKFRACLIRGAGEAAKQVNLELEPYMDLEIVQYQYTSLLAELGILNRGQGQPSAPPPRAAEPVTRGPNFIDPSASTGPDATETVKETKLWLPD